MHPAESTGHNRAQTVAAEDDACAVCLKTASPRFRAREHAADGAAFVHEAIDLHAFAHDGAGRFRRGAQNRVEPDARQREAERLKAPRDSVAARRHDFHSCEMRRGCRRDRGQHIRAQPLEHSGRFRA